MLLNLICQQATLNNNTCRLKSSSTAAIHFGIGIAYGKDHPRNTRIDKRLSTGRRAAKMGAGFKGNVCRCALCPSLRCFQSHGFGVITTRWLREPLGNNLIALRQHAAHVGIRARPKTRAGSKAHSQSHVTGICG